jgi:hypothetical protein
MADLPFSNHREAALALLNGANPLTRNAGQFLGQIVADPSTLSARQRDWLTKLLANFGLPPMADPCE